MDQQRQEYQHQLESIRERLEHEEACKRKLQNELHQINTNVSSEGRVSEFLKSSYEETIAELKDDFDRRVKDLQTEHHAELEEEKNATK